MKREDLHHFGSHKGRSIPLMIKEYTKHGADMFVISSSGNAALASIYAIQEHNHNNAEHPLTLQIYVGKHIPEEKLHVLQSIIMDSRITLTMTERAKQTAFLYAQEKKAILLRQSTDDLALTGYASLAEELHRIPHLKAIFIPTSSGTTAQALGMACSELIKNTPDETMPQIHVVQTIACHPIADACKKNLSPDSPSSSVIEAHSLATAIVDHVAKRKIAVVAVVKKSGGAGWIVTDDEIQAAIQLIESTAETIISPNSALSVAGLTQAIHSGMTWDGPVACLITGR